MTGGGGGTGQEKTAWAEAPIPALASLLSPWALDLGHFVLGASGVELTFFFFPKGFSKVLVIFKGFSKVFGPLFPLTLLSQWLNFISFRLILPLKRTRTKTFKLFLTRETH